MTEEVKKPKRRFLRFSLRTFLLVLTIFCVWLGWYLYRVEQQRNAVKWVLENGGEVGFDDEIDRAVPKWLYDMLGVDYFSTITYVDAINTQVSDVTPLAGLTNLEGLALYDTQVSDVSPLDGLTNLEELGLAGTQVCDVTPLAGLTNLEHLDLSDTQVNDLTPIAGLTNLKGLMLSRTQVSDVAPLAGLKNLRELYLDNTQISDEEIEKLKLALPNCQIEY